MLNATKNKTTPTTKTVLLVLKPISKKALIKSTIEVKKICLGLLCFSPKTAAGPIAAKPKSIAGR